VIFNLASDQLAGADAAGAHRRTIQKAVVHGETREPAYFLTVAKSDRNSKQATASQEIQMRPLRPASRGLRDFIEKLETQRSIWNVQRALPEDRRSKLLALAEAAHNRECG
jgi:hypothetical protein